MQFIDTDDGYIPIDRVIRILPGMRKGDIDRIEYDAVDDTRVTNCALPRQLGHEGDPIPAAPGFFAVGVIDDTKELYKVPIVGWRVIHGYAEPVTPDDSDQNAAVLCPDGTVIDPFCAAYENIEAFKRDKAA